jgi:hypothetical protein
MPNHRNQQQLECDPPLPASEQTPLVEEQPFGVLSEPEGSRIIGCKHAQQRRNFEKPAVYAHSDIRSP